MELSQSEFKAFDDKLTLLIKKDEERKAKAREYAKKHYAAHKDDVLARTKAYHEAHKDKKAEAEKRYYESHKDDIKKRSAFNNAKYRAFYKAYISQHPDFTFEV